jgi:TetR/AcrR family transcriptional repressor of nem operon
MPRTTNPEKIRRLLDATRDLLLRDGFGGASVGQICRQAGISKGGFFHHYKTKEDAIIAVARDFVIELGQRFKTLPRTRGQDPGRRVLHYIDFTIEACEHSTLAGGCLIGVLSASLPGDSATRVRALCREAFTAWIVAFETLLQGAQQAGLLPDRPDTRSLAGQFVALVEGSLLLRNALGPAVLRSNLRGFRELLAQMMSQGATLTPGRKDAGE